MNQKILKVGSSAAVTIPKNTLHELGLKIGDRITLSVNKANKQLMMRPAISVDAELVEWTRGFIEKYRPALEALAKK